MAAVWPQRIMGISAGNHLPVHRERAGGCQTAPKSVQPSESSCLSADATNCGAEVSADLGSLHLNTSGLCVQGMDASTEPLSPFASYVSDQEKERQRAASGASAGTASAPKAIPGAKEAKPPKVPNDTSSSADAGSASPLADTPTSGAAPPPPAKHTAIQPAPHPWLCPACHGTSCLHQAANRRGPVTACACST